MQRFFSIVPLLLALSLLSISCASAPEMRSQIEMRSQMLQAAKQLDQDFPDGIQTKLTEFAYIGDVATSDGSKLRVAMARSIITGMLAPRGQAWLSFHDQHGRFVGEHKIDASSPALWCDGPRVYFFGMQTNGEERGNALDLHEGFARRKYVLAPAVGSWAPSAESEAANK